MGRLAEGCGDLSRPAGGEPGWVHHAIWWRVYPLGFVDAFPETASGPASPGEHRLLRLVGWLDHAVRLGASGIALGPVFASTSHGYDTLDHFRLDPRLGEDGDLERLVEEAHARGLRVQLDGVFNHVGRDHPRAAAEGWLSGDSFEGHDALVALDHESPRVRTLVVEVMRHWLDRGVDGWRLDAAYAVPEEFWAQVLGEVRSTHPDTWFEAEVIHGDYVGFVERSTVDTVTQYELWKAIWSSINDQNLHELAWALQRHNDMLAVFAPATFIGNHDVTRIASRITDRRHLPHAVALLAVLGGTPTVYAGDELGLEGVKEDRAGGDDAVRPPFPPDPADLPGDQDLLRTHQELIGLRRRHPWLHRATSSPVLVENARCVLELSGDAGERLTLALNLSDEPLQVGDTALGPHGWRVLGE